MSYNGSGVYTLPGAQLANGATISATENNQFRNDVATALNTCWTRDGQAPATANIPMGSFKLTGLGAATTSGDALSYGNAAVVTTLTSTLLTATRVPYAGTGGLLQDASTFTFDGTTLTAGGFSGPHNGTVGATTPNTGAFTTLTTSSTVTVNGGTANGVAYLNGSKVLTTGSNLVFDGTALGIRTGANALNYILEVVGTSRFQDTFAQNGLEFAAGSPNVVTSYNRTTSTWLNLRQRAAEHEFYVSGSEQMRINSDGYLLVGYTSSNGAYKLQVNSQIFATNATIATSDGRYKENVQPVSDALNVINALNPVTFNWKQHPVHAFDIQNPAIGFIAQEVQQALADQPYLNSVVKGNEVTLPDETKEEFLGLAESALIPVLVKALQELKAELDATKAEVAALKGV